MANTKQGSIQKIENGKSKQLRNLAELAIALEVNHSLAATGGAVCSEAVGTGERAPRQK